MRARTRIAIAGVVLLLGLVAVWWASKATRWQICGELVWQVQTSERVVALTFDDGPVPGHVDDVLQALRARNARATFFLTGEGIAADRSDAVKILAAGHEVGNHSYSHRRMILRSDRFIRDEIERTDRLIRELGAHGEIPFRPPYGKKLLGLPLYLARNHRRTVTWTIEAEADPSHGRDPASIANYVVANVRPGTIVLFHVLMRSREPERRALPVVLARLAEAGYRFATVSELVALERRSLVALRNSGWCPRMQVTSLAATHTAWNERFRPRCSTSWLGGPRIGLSRRGPSRRSGLRRSTARSPRSHHCRSARRSGSD